jgi:hypothetical protein
MDDSGKDNPDARRVEQKRTTTHGAMPDLAHLAEVQARLQPAIPPSILAGLAEVQARL